MKEKNKYEFKESTVDEAVAAGLRELGISRDEADIEIKSYGGLFSKACVIITPKEKPEEEAVEAVAEEAEEVFEETVPVLEEADEEEMAGAEQAALEFVSDLALKMGLTSHVTSRRSGNEIFISIEGDDAGTIIGYRGEVLDAIQYYALVIANKGEKNFIRVQIDAGNYRKRRQETLANLAIRLAKKVARTGRKTELEPMNPYERRIIHTTLMNDKFVTTESEGEGRNRHVVILPKNNRPRSDRGEYRSDRGDRRDYPRGDRRDNPRPERRERTESAPRQEAPDSEKTERTSSDFKKKGFGKTRSFGYNNKRF